MFKNHKKFLKAIFFLLFLIMGGWFLFCHYALENVKKELVLWEKTLKEEGFEISYNALAFQQNFLSFKANLVQPHLKNPKGFGMQAKKIEVTLQPWNWQKMAFFLPDSQDIILYFGAFKKEVSIKNAKGFIHLTKKNELEEFFLALEKVHSFYKEEESLQLQNFLLDFKMLSTPLDSEFNLNCELTGIDRFFDLKDAQPVIFMLKTHLTGFQDKELPSPSLEVWRKGGGVLDINAFRVSWVPFEIKGEGTIAIDENMYPLGSFSTEITGYEEILKKLASCQIIEDKTAVLLTLAFNILSRSNSKGKQEIHVPITFQDRKIFVNSIPVYAF